MKFKQWVESLASQAPKNLKRYDFNLDSWSIALDWIEENGQNPFQFVRWLSETYRRMCKSSERDMWKKIRNIIPKWSRYSSEQATEANIWGVVGSFYDEIFNITSYNALISLWNGIILNNNRLDNYLRRTQQFFRVMEQKMADWNQAVKDAILRYVGNFYSEVVDTLEMICESVRERFGNNKQFLINTSIHQ